MGMPARNDPFEQGSDLSNVHAPSCRRGGVGRHGNEPSTGIWARERDEPAVAARLVTAGHTCYELSLGSLAARSAAAAALCATAPSLERDGFALRSLA